ncbi:ring-cleaving dioxygenase [bacterium]|nr:MAG: ring-cleaving dioxygenase [bacterium]
MALLGLHHVSCLCGDAQANVDFYVGKLGLRLVKRTVNFDDPGSYHLYYGDGRGTPGTLLTFFPLPLLNRGRGGAGSVTSVSLAARPDSVRWWSERLEGRLTDDGSLEFEDPDGLPLRIVPIAKPPLPAAWPGLTVPPEHALGAIERARMETAAFDDTRWALETLGFEELEDNGEVATFGLSGGGPVKTLEVQRSAGNRFMNGTGTVHHIAWRVADDEEQQAWRERLSKEGFHVSPVRDRDYFRSIYFREPGGTLFELATDGPGFAADERPEHLGESLKLPPFAEPHRAQIESALPPLTLP